MGLKSPYNSAKFPLWLLILMVVVIVGNGVWAWALSREYQREVNALGQEAVRLAQGGAAQTERLLFGLDQLLLGVRDVLQSSEFQATPFHPTMRALLQQRMQKTLHLLDILVMDPAGSIVHWTETGIPPQIKDRPYFTYHLSHPDPLYIAPPLLSRIHSGQWFFAVSRKVLNPDQSLQHVLVGIVGLDSFLQGMKGVPQKAGWRVQLVHTQANQMLAAWPELAGTPGDQIVFEGERDSSWQKTDRGIEAVVAVEGAPLIARVQVDPQVALTAWYSEALIRFGFVLGADLLLGGLIVAAARQFRRQQKVQFKLSRRERQYRLLAENTTDVIWTSDLEGRLRYVSPSIKRLSGYAADEVRGKAWESLLSAESRLKMQPLLEQLRSGDPEWPGTQLELEMIGRDGEPLWTEVSLSWQRDEAGEPIVLQGVSRDISRRRKLENHLRRMAITDPLTGVYNRRHFMTIGQQEIGRCQRKGSPLSLMMMDLDHFKAVNDTYGHRVGDRALRALSNLCRAELRSHDAIGRFGGEEFVILLPEAALMDARKLADRLRRKVEAFQIKTATAELNLTVSIGVSEWLPGEADLNRALELADQAMYRSKAAGRNRVEVAHRSTQTLLAPG